MSDLAVKPDEEKELQEAKIEVAKSYYLTPKYQLWESYFLDKKNKDTYGNATASALKAYNLDREDPKAYRVARVIGSKNITKVNNLRKEYFEAQGLTYGRMLDLYNNVLIERKDINMLYALAKDMGMPLPKYENITGPKVLNQNNTQINGDVQIDFTNLKNE